MFVELVPAPELDVRHEDSIIHPANMLVPTNEVEERALRKLIATWIIPSSSVRFGRKGKRRHIAVDNGYRLGRRCEVVWEVEKDNPWYGWCISELDSLDLCAAARVVDVESEIRLQYALLEPEFSKEMYRHPPTKVLWSGIELYIPEEVAAVSA